MALWGGDVGAYRPPLSLWRLVEQNVSPEQHDEIRSMLGTSLIETSLDLHNEIDMLLEIWRDYQDRTEAQCSSRSPVLAEPPHVRERLVQEICFLAEGIRERSLRRGMSPSDLFSAHNSHIVHYAEEAKRSGSSLERSRPTSVMSSDGRMTPLSPSQLATSRSELCDVIEDEVTSTADRLNYLQFDSVCERLRETLEREVVQLEADVSFLHGCLEDASNVHHSASASPSVSREPTITELREERTLLERDLLSSDSLPITPSCVGKTSFKGKNPTNTGKMPSLEPLRTKLRPPAAALVPPSGRERASASSKAKGTTPLRANHDMRVTSPPFSSSSSSSSSQQEFSAPLTSPPEGSAARGNPEVNAVTAMTYDLELLESPEPLAGRVRSPPSSSPFSPQGGSTSPSQDSFGRGQRSRVNNGRSGFDNEGLRISGQRSEFSESERVEVGSGNEKSGVENCGESSEVNRESSRVKILELSGVGSDESSGVNGERSKVNNEERSGLSNERYKDSNESSRVSAQRSEPSEMSSRVGTEKSGERSGVRRRGNSPGRVKVVPVGSLVASGPFLPTPPSPPNHPPAPTTTTTLPLRPPRPGSAERFRKMVMTSRETT